MKWKKENFIKLKIYDAFCVVIELVFRKFGKILITEDFYRNQKYGYFLWSFFCMLTADVSFILPEYLNERGVKNRLWSHS